MEGILPIAYLATLVALLGVLAWLIARQIVKGRQLESVISDLQPKLEKEKGEAQDYYELASVYLKKKLYAKSISELQKAIKAGGENMPEIYNALGYAYFAQQQFDLSIKNYKEAIERQPDYVIALNNLGHAYEKKKLLPQAIEVYDKALSLNPKNDIAKRRLDSLRKRVTTTPSK
ncbi:tetratricopeptide repeat protein [Tumidithrix helvetica]|uniref:tetratricopeptide repeat protein n=1 Tax=Tumidithrix helvetica TaxID=3457545 RepID=UPI003CC683AB